MKRINIILLLVLLQMVIFSCSEEEEHYVKIKVHTSAVKDVRTTSAFCGGNIVEGGDKVSQRGVVWGTRPNVSLENSIGRTKDGKEVGVFESEITGLRVNTTYFIRAYATNKLGTEYGYERDFKTLFCEMISVKGGSFQMGSDAEEKQKPEHTVKLSDFEIGRNEVTQGQWENVMGSNPSRFQGYNLPVEKVSWEDIERFLIKLNADTGENFRLPTEAEWEYAARGGEAQRSYSYSGSNAISDVAWYSNNSSSTTHRVRYKRANNIPQAADAEKKYTYDMSGNVSEWCSDWYAPYDISKTDNPVGPASGIVRVVRGGSWDDYPNPCKVKSREFFAPNTRSDKIGFRLARSK